MQELGAHAQYERAKVSRTRQLSPEEAAHLFQKDGTSCAPYAPTGFDLAPTGCDHRRVCWDSSGKLACGNCRKVEGDCPDYAKSRVYALFSDVVPVKGDP